MGSTGNITSSFIEEAPPGEIQDVVKDIKILTSDDDPALIAKLKPAFEKYNEDQMVAVKLPGASDYV
jgi:capping protein alpha